MSKRRRVTVWALVLSLALSGMPVGAFAQEMNGPAESEAVAEAVAAMEEQEAYFLEEAAEPEELDASGTESGEGWTMEHGILRISGMGTIPEGMFAGREDITEVYIEGVETIGARAFEGCANIYKVDLGAGLKKIGANAFRYCYLQEVDFLGTVREWFAVEVEEGNDQIFCILPRQSSMGSYRLADKEMLWFVPQETCYYEFSSTGAGNPALAILHVLEDADDWEMIGLMYEEGDLPYRLALELTAGEVYLIFPYGEEGGSYDVAFKKAAPVLTGVSNTATGVKVTWEPLAEETVTYRVFRRTAGTTKWNTVGNTTATGIIDTKAVSGTKYDYTVRAVSSDNKYISDYDHTGKSILFLSGMKPTLSNAASGVTVKWSKVTGAQGYYLYRKEAGAKSYTKIATIKDPATVSYTDTAVKSQSGTTFTYAIKAYNGSTYGGYTGVSILYLAGITPTLSNASGGITVKWTKVEGAKGYYVYRKEVGAASYTKIATITKGDTVSYSDTAVKSNNGKAYTYAVKAYNGSTYGAYTAKNIVRMTTVTITSLTNPSAGKITVKWGKNAAATGYVIQYATNSSFSDVKNVYVTGAATLTKSITGLTRGKTYYVRVRPYKTLDSVKHYSHVGTAKTIKLTK